ncbi:MAG: hypothetical protein K6G03_03750, partial [Lachnospiraceae bacterium]|nr:hypothetical protein [Lachnospiraceae bacterium]
NAAYLYAMAVKNGSTEYEEKDRIVRKIVYIAEHFPANSDLTLNDAATLAAIEDGLSSFYNSTTAEDWANMADTLEKVAKVASFFDEDTASKIDKAKIVPKVLEYMKKIDSLK